MTATRERSLRAWWTAAAAAVAGAAVYVSLVPFEFDRLPPGVSFQDALLGALDVTWTARGNLLANAVMFLPFGFFGAAALLDDRRGIARWLAAGSALLIVSVLLSISVEAAQVFVRGRTPSIADVTFQTAGLVAGVMGWAIVGREVRAWCLHFSAGTRTALEVGLAVYAAVAFLILIEPFDITVAPSAIAAKLRTGGIVINPLRSSAWSLMSVPPLLADLVLAMPLGVLAVVAGRAAGVGRRPGVALAGALSFFAIGEVAQVFIRSRTADVMDFAANAAGATTGVLLARAFLVTPGPQQAQSPRRAGAPVFGVALAGALVFYAVYNLSPFDFHLSRDLFVRRVGWLVDLPFRGYYQNPEFKALADLLTKTAMALPIGVFFHLRVRPDRTVYHRLIAVAWVLLATTFIAAVEVGQVFLPSRYPDGTDVLIGGSSVALGLALACRFTRDGVGRRLAVTGRAPESSR